MFAQIETFDWVERTPTYSMSTELLIRKHLSPDLTLGGWMSRGPGFVERTLLSVFAVDPRGVFTTEELCYRVFRISKVDKKHRVSVLRALKRLSQTSMPTLWRAVPRGQRDDEWYDRRYYPGRKPNSASAAKPRPRKE